MRQLYVRRRWPWIEMEDADLRPQSDPETVIFLPDQTSIVGLQIKGLDGPAMLNIREDARGHPLSCVDTNEIYIDTAPAQSNPRRRLTDGSDSA